MMDQRQFEEWCSINNLPEKTIKVIENIRMSPPSRKVKSGWGNVSGIYPSRKMKLTIQFESHTLELALIYILEHDPDVLEYYDQPPRFKLAYSNQKRNIALLYTADFFVIRGRGAEWIECKPEEKLEKLSAKWPTRYIKKNDGCWHCPPGEDHAQKIGLSFSVFSSRHVNPTFLRNTVFLEDFYQELKSPEMETISVPEEFCNKVISLVSTEPGIRLNRLIEQVGIDQVDNIYRLIINERIHADLTASPLAEPDRVHIFKDSDIAMAYSRIGKDTTSAFSNLESILWQPGESVIFDGKQLKITLVGDTKTYLKTRDGKELELSNDRIAALVKKGELRGIVSNEDTPLKREIGEIISKASDKDIANANRRLPIVRAYMSGAKIKDPDDSIRTIQRLTQRFKKAEELYGDGYLGLISNHSRKGPTMRKKEVRSYELMHEVIKDHYENTTQLNKKIAYGVYELKCSGKGIDAYCYKVFSKEIEQRPKHNQTRERKGHKAAYKFEHWYLHKSTPRHGDRPFEITHIDHTELDIELITSSGINLGRPWITFLTDAFSRRLLAFLISFNHPSIVSCLTVLRMCVERHSRLPQTIIVDGGKEFKSTDFERFLGRFEITKKTRPKSKARFGSTCERLFGTTKTQFINTLSGNTQNSKNVRELTKETNPKELAIWTLSDLTDSLSRYLFEVYDTALHPALCRTPRDVFDTGMALAGDRPHRLIACNESFIIFTLPSTRKGTAKVIPGRGIIVNNITYWSNSFNDATVENTNVSIRFDPLDVGIVFAYVNKRWERCESEYYFALHGRSLKEIRNVSETMRRQHKIIGRNFRSDAKRLADFYLSNRHKEYEQIMMQHLKDNENKKVQPAGIDSKVAHSKIQSIETARQKHLLKQKSTRTAKDISSYGEY